MPTLQAYKNGLTMGHAGHNGSPPLRGEVTGWTPASVRRHTRWLYGVEAPALTGYGYAVTLTIRETPPDAASWQAARAAWVERLRRRGMVRLHWVVEWQRRGTPHLHCAVYFAEPLAPVDQFGLIAAWLEVTNAWGPRAAAQTIKPITGAEGWLQYLSKHAARGVKHYQRWGKPDGWLKTGRLWGHAGDWPTEPPIRADLTLAEYHRLRRLVRSWRVADARAAGDWTRLTYARRMLACPDRALSSVRGVSEWIPDPLALRLLDALD